MVAFARGSTAFAGAHTSAQNGANTATNGPSPQTPRTPAPDALLVPASLAANANGDVYVADIAAQRISRIASDGNVSVFAGDNPYTTSSLYASGGFADGSASVARFRHPGALALARDGSVYVADTYNHCIRRIAAGSVSTYAGNAEQSTVVDGPRGSARFMYPRALAFDAAGNLYVADYTVGIRKIASDGSVSTLRLPAIGTDITSLSAFDDASGAYLFASDDLRTVAVNLTTMHADVWGEPPPDGANPAVRYRALEGGREAGRMSSIVALGPSTFAYADARSGEIKLIVGDALGSVTQARLGSPLGIARVGNTLVVSDSQHHRVVRYPLPDLRSYSDSTPPQKDSRTFRVAVVSNSFAFYDTLWSESIPGVLEERLRADANARHLTRLPQTIAVRFASIDALRSYIDEEVEPGQVDAVVLLVNTPFVYEPIFGGKNWGSNLATAPGTWRSQLTASLAAFRSALEKKTIPLYTVVHPLAIELSPQENLDAREAQSGGVASDEGSLSYAAFADAVKSALIGPGQDFITAHFDDAMPAMAFEESQPEHAALYGSFDFHFDAAGRAFIADRIVKMIESDTVWRGLRAR